MNSAFEVPMLGYPQTLFAPFRSAMEGGTMVVNHGRVASLDPQEGCGESVVNLWRYPSASKIGWAFRRLDKDNDKAAGGQEEGRRG